MCEKPSDFECCAVGGLLSLALILKLVCSVLDGIFND